MYIAGLVISIIGIVVGLIPILGWFAVPLNLAALIIGGIGIARKKIIEKSEYNKAVATVILGAIPLALKIIIWSSIYPK